jgi:hypothetical protein
VTHYDVLGVAPSATPHELHEAYLSLARRHHPDVAGHDAGDMRAVNAAWAVLGDPVQRAAYDVQLGLRRAGARQHEPRDDDLAADLAADIGVDLDDRPVVGSHVVPPEGWLAVAPVAVFAGSVALFSVGLVIAMPAMLVLAVGLFVVSCGLFVLAPLWAMSRHRRRADR